MALDNLTVKTQYSLSGTFPVTFPITFPYWDSSDVYAVLTTAIGDTQLIQPADFTVSSPDGISGTLTRVTNWTGGVRLTIYRSLTRKQLIDLTNGGRIDANVLEKMVDKLTAMVQELSEQVGRTVMFYPITDGNTAGTFPVQEERASKFLGFDVNGAPIAAEAGVGPPITDYMKTVLDDTDSATARATLEVNKTNIDALGINATNLVGEVPADFHDAAKLTGAVPLSTIPAQLTGKTADESLHTLNSDKLGGQSPASTAVVSSVMIRDINGRSKVATPVEVDDIARKDTVDNATSGVSSSLSSHVSGTGSSVHGATPSAISNQIITRDANGRAQVIHPSGQNDIATLYTSGLAHIAGDFVKASSSGGVTSDPPTIVSSIPMRRGGAVRLKAQITPGAAADWRAWFYVNGVAVSGEYVRPTSMFEDHAINAGNSVQLVIRTYTYTVSWAFQVCDGYGD